MLLDVTTITLLRNCKPMSLSRLLAVFSLLLSISACASIDCPLDNQVLMTLKFYDAATQTKLTLPQTLSVYGLKNGKEELLFNQGKDLSAVSLPLNVASDRDTLILKFTEGDASMSERIVIDHARQQHFESIDCPAVTFHTLQSIAHTSHDLSVLALAIESVRIANPKVQYEDIEHLKVFFRTSAQ